MAAFASDLLREPGMLIDLQTHEQAWQQRPLCQSYRLICVEALAMRIRQPDEARTVIARWAVGWLSAREPDLLGVWLDDGPSHSFQPFRPRLIDDLRSRGVESLGHVVERTSGRKTAPSQLAYGPLNARLLVLSAKAETALRPLNAALVRAVVRVGGFDDAASATTFLAGALMRAERHLNVRGQLPNALAAGAICRQRVRCSTASAV
ncbi:hypothetical protein CLD22_16745 [Rubrivivax gelatinosus]|nr:hypothetical protein [Rubrivivax gelatinosus]